MPTSAKIIAHLKDNAKLSWCSIHTNFSTCETSTEQADRSLVKYIC